jgi:ABC-2 type transport system permease protein
VIRAFLTGLRLQLKQASRNAFDMSGVVVWPILYASIAYYLLGHGERRFLLAATFGAALMLTWSLVVISSSGALEQQRWQGTLELVVAAPVPLTAVIASLTVGGGLVGLYSIGATLAWGALVFDVPVHIEHPFAFAVSLPLSAVAIGMLGLIMASTFVLYRASFHLGIATQYPMWIVTGLLFPVSLLPAYVRPIGWLLAPFWGFNAIKESALGGTPWPDIGMCAALSVVYLAIGSAFLVVFEGVARARGSLRLT